MDLNLSLTISLTPDTEVTLNTLPNTESSFLFPLSKAEMASSFCQINFIFLVALLYSYIRAKNGKKQNKPKLGLYPNVETQGLAGLWFQEFSLNIVRAMTTSINVSCQL